MSDKQEPKTVRGWNPFSLLTKFETNSGMVDAAYGNGITAKRLAKTNLLADGITPVPAGVLAPESHRRLYDTLSRLHDYYGQSPERPDSAMFGMLAKCVSSDYGTYMQTMGKGNASPVLSTTEEVARAGKVGFGPYTVNAREFHDKVSSWIPTKDGRQIHDVVAQALGAKDWVSLYPAFNEQFRNERRIWDEMCARNHDVVDVKAELRFASHMLVVAHAGSRLKSEMHAPATFRKMHAIVAVATGIYENMESQGFVTDDIARKVRDRIRSDRGNLGHATPQQSLGDWSPAGTAAMLGVQRALDCANEALRAQGKSSAFIEKLNSKMELLNCAWSASKQPHDTQVPILLQRVAALDNPIEMPGPVPAKVMPAAAVAQAIGGGRPIQETTNVALRA